MAANRYDQAVSYDYISQYVPNPIPFQELVTLGKYYADERKALEKLMSIAKEYDVLLTNIMRICGE